MTTRAGRGPKGSDPAKWIWLGVGAAAALLVTLYVLSTWGPPPTETPKVVTPSPPKVVTPTPPPKVEKPKVTPPPKPQPIPGVNDYDRLGYALLHLAARNGSPTDIHRLIDGGADVNLPTREYGYSPIFQAVEAKKIENVRALLDRGADVNRKSLGVAPFTPLIRACQDSSLEMVRLLLDRGADVNLTCGNKEGWTWGPLRTAAACGHLELVKMLVERGATVKGSSALHAAAEIGSLPLARFLLEHGASVGEINPIGETPLVNAATKHQSAMVKFLIEKGADVNAASTGRYSRTLLHHLVYFEDLEIAAIALEHGGDVNMKDFEGKTVLDSAVDRERVAFIEFLISKVPSLAGPATLAVVARCKDPKLVELLLEKGIPVDARDAGGSTALHVAAQKGCTRAVDVLIKKGANIEARTSRGDTPLMLAAEGHQAETVRQLLDAGAKVNAVREAKAPTGRGRTALHSAARAGALDAAKLLLEKGANVKARTTDGQTPADLAKIATDELASRDRWDLLELLQNLEHPPKPKPKRIVYKVEEGKVTYLEGTPEDRKGRTFKVISTEIADGAVVTTEEEVVKEDEGKEEE